MFWVVLCFLSLSAADVGFIGFAQPRHCQLRLCSRSNNAGVFFFFKKSVIAVILRLCLYAGAHERTAQR